MTEEQILTACEAQLAAGIKGGESPRELVARVLAATGCDLSDISLLSDGKHIVCDGHCQSDL
jgi:hypothetical protein